MLKLCKQVYFVGGCFPKTHADTFCLRYGSHRSESSPDYVLCRRGYGWPLQEDHEQVSWSDCWPHVSVPVCDTGRYTLVDAACHPEKIQGLTQVIECIILDLWAWHDFRLYQAGSCRHDFRLYQAGLCQSRRAQTIACIRQGLVCTAAPNLIVARPFRCDSVLFIP